MDERTLSRREANPCPWCGAQPVIEPQDGDDWVRYMVTCDSDRCSMKPSVTAITELLAMMLWNQQHGGPYEKT